MYIYTYTYIYVYIEREREIVHEPGGEAEADDGGASLLEIRNSLK